MTDTPEIPDDFEVGSWLSGDGPESDIAICTRVRFARNIEGFRFSTNMTPEEAEEIDRYLCAQIERIPLERDDGGTLRIVKLPALDETARGVLMERHLISRDHAQSTRCRSVAFDEAESISVMINEEDHLRSQVFGPGLQVEATYAAAEAFDEAVIRSVPIAFSEQFGFLTSCPTNTGTGMRVSVMLHLPGLVWADEMEKAANTAQKIHLAVRGLYGEGSRATGDFYQVSNQVTLGRSEAQIVDDVAQAVQRFVVWERKVRQALFEGERRIQTVDKIYRALGTLRAARILTSEECLNSLSAVRLGVHQGMIPELSTNSLNQILLLSQPAHLQDLFQQKLAPHERDQRRASLVRKILGGDDDTGD